MARTARNRTQESPVEQKGFRVGIYARLSVERDDRKNESIDTQVEIAKQYMISHPEMVLYDVYTDLGATGTNFGREGFERMMQDIRRGNVDCVIVKDLSRFGRNCVETGNYIQKIFPFMKVRFIAVSDSIDTFDPELTPDELTVNLKNLINELYARDIAKKVKASRRVQWENGSFTGGVGPYGYRYEWNGKIKSLVVDPEAAEIVKEIYQMFLGGKNMSQIARALFERKIHPPSFMHASGNVCQQEGEPLKAWTHGSVKMVLTNPVYMGCLIQAAACGKKYRLRDRCDIESGDFHIHMNTHEAIISEEDFYKAAQKFEKMDCNQKGVQKEVPLEEDIYRDILFCGDCGKKMARITNIKMLGSGDRIRWYGYRCCHSDQLEIKCPAKGIAKIKLDEFVLATLEREFKLSSMRPQTVVEQCKEASASKISLLERKRTRAEGEMFSLNKKLSELYMQYRMGDMTVNEYQKKKKELDCLAVVQRERLDTCDLELRRNKMELEQRGKFLRDFMKGKKKNIVLTREIVTALVRRIEIYTDHRVKIQFAFHMNELLESVIPALNSIDMIKED